MEDYNNNNNEDDDYNDNNDNEDNKVFDIELLKTILKNLKKCSISNSSNDNLYSKVPTKLLDSLGPIIKELETKKWSLTYGGKISRMNEMNGSYNSFYKGKSYNENKSSNNYNENKTDIEDNKTISVFNIIYPNNHMYKFIVYQNNESHKIFNQIFSVEIKVQNILDEVNKTKNVKFIAYDYLTKKEVCSCNAILGKLKPEDTKKVSLTFSIPVENYKIKKNNYFIIKLFYNKEIVSSNELIVKIIKEEEENTLKEVDEMIGNNSYAVRDINNSY